MTVLAVLLLAYYSYLSLSFFHVVRELQPSGYSDLPDMVNNYWVVVVSALFLHLTKRVIV
jgi:hypothetical protein